MQHLREHILDGTPADIVARYESLAEFAAQADFGVLDSNVVVLDTETTGLDVDHDDIVQIAAVKMRGGVVLPGSEFDVCLDGDAGNPDVQCLQGFYL